LLHPSLSNPQLHVAEGEQIPVMARHEHGATRCRQRSQDADERRAPRPVEAHSGLVEEQDGTAREETLGEREAAGLAGREAERRGAP
jgi:hypothetical protein